jgi:glyoxylase-like metal-dependent hydrolase (beta-lactamase superfamily II)
MKLEMLTVGPFEENCYLYWDEKTGRGVIFDPGDEAERIIETVKRAGFKPGAILLTHGHGDHIGALNEVRKEWSLPVYIGKGEEEYLTDPHKNGSANFGVPICAERPDFTAEDEKIYRFDSIELRVLSTPGHTKAGVCYLDEHGGVLFCGDTLFQGSIGRTDLYGGSFETLINSIQKKILTLPDNIVCLPGHGPGTTVGAERIGNPFLTGKHRFA